MITRVHEPYSTGGCVPLYRSNANLPKKSGILKLNLVNKSMSCFFDASELHVCWSRASWAMKNDPISSEKLDIMEELLLSRANNGR